MSNQYTIGIDFGTLSARAVLLCAETGEELAASEFVYPHGVMDTALPSGKRLPPRYALQHPQDYLDALKMTVGEVLRQGNIPASSVVGLCIDFTSCTVISMAADGTPLCMTEAYCDHPLAYAKLWKHHGAIPYAEEITAKARARGERWLPLCGGTVSSEWLLPKVAETLREAPELYRDTARFAEAGDWLSFLLTGEHTTSASFAGLKALWTAEDGFPSNDFFISVDPRLDGILGSKLCSDVRPAAASVGRLTDAGAALTGLAAGTVLAAPAIDGTPPVPALSSVKKGEMTMIVGTSSVDLLLAEAAKAVPGLCGCAKDAVIPDYYTYEAGQTGVGDMFAWFVQNCVPRAYEEEAEALGMNIHAYLRNKASALRIGESRLIALDWFNGNRSILKNEALTGLILGLTINTRPEEIYRALIEATAFGTRKIIERFEEYGLAVDCICAAGGIAQKDPMMMQIYADVTQREIRVVNAKQPAARGCAIYAAVAAGLFPNLDTAVRHFALPEAARYTPVPAHSAAYEPLYAEYSRLYAYFGKGDHIG